MNNNAQSPKFVAAVKETILQEISLQERYQIELQKSEAAVTAMDIAAMAACDEIRENLNQQITHTAEKRKELIAEFPEDKLSQVIEAHCLEADKVALRPLVLELRKKVELTQKNIRMFNQLLDFGGRVVNGTLSILTSANVNVTRGYTRKGNVVEQFRNLKDEIKKV